MESRALKGGGRRKEAAPAEGRRDGVLRPAGRQRMWRPLASFFMMRSCSRFHSFLLSSARFSYFHPADELHDFLAVHQELARAVRFERFVRADLIGGVHVRVAEKELAVADVDVRLTDLRAAGAHALDFPAAKHDAAFVALFNRIVVTSALVDNCHLKSLANFLFL